MKADMTVSNNGSEVSGSTDRAVISTTAPLTLSYTPVISAVVEARPCGSSSRWSTIRCSPWTSIAGLNDPMVPNTPETSASVTTIVGSARWVMFIEFSVVNARSSVPAPTPRA